jgi:hypothetical protein
MDFLLLLGDILLQTSLQDLMVKAKSYSWRFSFNIIPLILLELSILSVKLENRRWIFEYYWIGLKISEQM